MRIETVAVHAGVQVDPATGAVTPAIHPSTTFERDPDGSFPHGHIYARSSAPNRAALEASLTALEGGADAVAFASASAATSAVFLSLAPGDHVVAPVDAYYGTGKLLREIYAGWGLAATFVDMTDLGAVEKAVRPTTRLVWAESPSNPLRQVSDLSRIGASARAVGARPEGRDVPRRAPARRARALSRAALEPRSRGRQAPDGDVRRHVVRTDPWQRGDGHGGGGEGAPLHPGDQLRRDGKPHGT